MTKNNENTRCVLLEMDGICKSFPGVRALDGVSISVKAGSVHALMGENGAGKSTLMKCLFGVYSKDAGEITLDGKSISFKTAKEALEGGVAMVHQELNQADKLTVAENMWLGRFPTLSRYAPLISERRLIRMTKEIFDSLGIKTSPAKVLGALSVSERQMVEIAKAVSYEAKIIVFDEPTSSLNEEEAERLFGMINKLKTNGCGIIYISHKMEEILKIADEVTVMRDGRHIATRPAEELTIDEIIRLMVGRELTERYPKKKSMPKDVLLRVENLSGRYSPLKNASFELKRSEILGVAGLDGAGRTELIETLFGLATGDGGEIWLDGKKITNRDPREAIRNGFALLTEERRKNGIFGILSVEANTVISSLKSYRRAGLLSSEKMRDATEDYIRSLRIKTPSAKAKIRNLSGGNQQKAIFARWLLTHPKVLLLDEPTRGIDVGAKYEIYQLITELADEGCGIIMVSSEMPELIGMSDRIIVMSGGRIAGEVERGGSQEKIMALATKYV